MNLTFALVLQSPINSLKVTTLELQNIARAVTIQLNRDYAPKWGGSYNVRVSDGTDLQDGEVVFSIVDSLPDEEKDVVALHTVTGNGVAVAYEAQAMCNSVTTGKDSMSVAISHECCETACDYACNEWVDDGEGSEYAKECCDSVESNYYAVSLDENTSIDVSAFALPAFFNPNDSKGPYSFPELPIKPLQTYVGGYQNKRTSGGGETQVTAEMSGRQRIHSLKRRHWSSRAYRRGLRGRQGA